VKLVEIKFAVLSVLAERPDGSAALSELDRELQARGQGEVGGLSDFDGIGVIEPGLAVLEHDRLRITETGRAVIRAYMDLGEPRYEVMPTVDLPHSLKRIDDLIGVEQRLKIFDLGLRSADGPFIEPMDEDPPIEAAPSQPAPTDPVDNIPGYATPDPVGLSDNNASEASGDTSLRAPALSMTEPPVFLRRSSPQRNSPSTPTARTRDSRALIARGVQRLLQIWRGHIQTGGGSPRVHRGEQRPGRTAGLAVIALTLLVLVAGAGALVAINQIRSLKAEIAALEKELAPLKKQAVRPAGSERRTDSDQASKAKESLEMRFARDNSPAQSSPGASSLILTSDEIRLIRDYIKPAPSGGAGGIPINVGDPVTSGTIPLPSPITDKIPKLQGARFTIRNGSIIITKRDSQKADAVLPPL
jgi:hypothetical protein